MFAARVTVGVVVLLLVGWPLWLLCVLADAWATWKYPPEVCEAQMRVRLRYAAVSAKPSGR